MGDEEETGLKILFGTRVAGLGFFNIPFVNRKACDQKLRFFLQGKPVLLVSCVSFKVHSMSRNTDLGAMCLVD